MALPFSLLPAEARPDLAPEVGASASWLPSLASIMAVLRGPQAPAKPIWNPNNPPGTEDLHQAFLSQQRGSFDPIPVGAQTAPGALRPMTVGERQGQQDMWEGLYGQLALAEAGSGRYGVGGEPNVAAAAKPEAFLAPRGVVGRAEATEPGREGSGGGADQGPSSAYKARSPVSSEVLSLSGAPVQQVYEATRPIPGADTPSYHELHPDRGYDAFHRSIADAKASSPFGAAVTLYDPADYQGMRLFTTPNADAGFALKGDDIVSVFKHAQAPHQAVTKSMLDIATNQGGRRLDAYDTVLPRLYSTSGFRAVARLPWDDRFAPDDWDYQRFSSFNGGRPDVVFMIHDPEATEPYERGAAPLVSDYDAGTAAQQAALKEIDARRRGRNQ